MRTIDPKKLPRIVAAAAELFAERPFAEVKMADVAVRAKVAKGTLYLHFANKEALFREVVAEASGRALDAVQTQMLAQTGFEDKLRSLIRAAVKFTNRFPHYLETLYRLDASPQRETDAALRSRRERLYEMIEGLLRDAGTSEGIVVSQSGRSTLALLGMLHRVMHGTPRPWPTDLADWIVDQFLNGVRRTE